jgi:hypothetical protein
VNMENGKRTSIFSTLENNSLICVDPLSDVICRLLKMGLKGFLKD